MAKKRMIAAYTVTFYEDHPPEIEMRENVIKISEELFSKALEQVRSHRNKVRVKVSNRQRRDERLKVQEELSNG